MTVTDVVDGDTIKVSNGKTLRLIGVDTPETVDPRKPVQCFGREASARAHALLDGARVQLEYDPTPGSARQVRPHARVRLDGRRPPLQRDDHRRGLRPRVHLRHPVPLPRRVPRRGAFGPRATTEGSGHRPPAPATRPSRRLAAARARPGHRVATRPTRTCASRPHRPTSTAPTSRTATSPSPAPTPTASTATTTASAVVESKVCRYATPRPLIAEPDKRGWVITTELRAVSTHGGVRRQSARGFRRRDARQDRSGDRERYVKEINQWCKGHAEDRTSLGLDEPRYEAPCAAF